MLPGWVFKTPPAYTLSVLASIPGSAPPCEPSNRVMNRTLTWTTLRHDTLARTRCFSTNRLLPRQGFIVASSEHSSSMKTLRLGG